MKDTEGKYEKIQFEDQLILNTLNNALNSGKDMEQIIEAGSDVMKKVFSGLGAGVYIYDRKTGNLVLKNPKVMSVVLDKVNKVLGYNIPELKITPGSNHMYMDIIKNKKTRLFSTPEDVQKMLSDFAVTLLSQKILKEKATSELLMKMYDELGIRSFIVVPLIEKSETVGLLSVSTSNYFSKIDIKRIKTIAGQFTSIIRRKQGEEALKKSEEKYRSLIDNLPGVVWSSDRDGKTYFISNNVKEVYGYTPGEIYERGADLWFGMIHENDRERVIKAYDDLFNKGIPLNVEYRIKRKDKTWIWLHDRSFG